MGTFSVKVTIRNLGDPAREATLECLVDTGATYSQAPRSLLVELGITPFAERPVLLADGRETTCQLGMAEFLCDDRRTPAIVVFAEDPAPALLGAMTLEGWGLGVDPARKRLVPLVVPMA
ncbi:MAG: hypothetical protein HYY85_17110 [Deltaproteobacteria bacterium]|nr:hypothetical protein [Deltaproteobacteria bacterium]